MVAQGLKSANMGGDTGVICGQSSLEISLQLLMVPLVLQRPQLVVVLVWPGRVAGLLAVGAQGSQRLLFSGGWGSILTVGLRVFGHVSPLLLATVRGLGLDFPRFITCLEEISGYNLGKQLG